MRERSIGVFDSGFGGLTAARQLRRIMPSENIIYFGDTARVPYGGRSRDTLLQYARQDMRFLREFDLKAILIACGTVSSNCLAELQQENDLPILGVVEPAVAAAVRATKNGRVGMVATRASVMSGAYERSFQALAPEVQVFSKACPLFVPLVEEGHCHVGDIVIETVAEEYLAALREQEIDTLVLGCTHYPLITDVIQKVMGSAVTLIDAGAASAEATRALLTERDLLAGRAHGEARYFTSDQVSGFERLASLFLGEDISGRVRKIDISGY